MPHIVLHLCNAVCGTDREVLCDTLPQRQQPQQPQQRQQRWWQASSQKQLSNGNSSGEEGHLSRCGQHLQSVPEARCAIALSFNPKSGTSNGRGALPWATHFTSAQPKRGQGIHGQHGGSSRVIHLSRGRRPNYDEVIRASNGRSVIRCVTRSATTMNHRTKRRCREPSLSLIHI